MKRLITKIGVFCVLALLTVGCGNFLEEHSQNMAYLEDVSDLNELLLGECYMKRNYSVDSSDADQGVGKWSEIMTDNDEGYFFPYIHLLDDDTEEYTFGNSGSSERGFARVKAGHAHHWQADPFLDGDEVEIKNYHWQAIYRKIAVLNTILFEFDRLKSEEPDTALRVKVEGDATFLRAQYYFFLANTYARPYCKQTAATDLCIPLKLNHDIETGYFSRSPMQEVWSQIEADLLRSVATFRGTESTTVYRAGYAAACALLSRVYLFTEQYEKSVAYADSVLNLDVYALKDFNNYKGENATDGESPETIFTQGSHCIAALLGDLTTDQWSPKASGYSCSQDLMQVFNQYEDDLRLQVFMKDRREPGTGKRCVKLKDEDAGGEISDTYALRLPEVYLNKAEALACLGRDAEAIAVVQELRANRFPTGKLPSVSESGEQLVNFIRDERRRELCFEGHRWFDLRRYAVNSVYPYTKSITHRSLVPRNGKFEGTLEGTYVLNPYSEEEAAAWMLPIPQYAIEFNEGELKNEIRPEREMIPAENE